MLNKTFSHPGAQNNSSKNGEKTNLIALNLFSKPYKKENTSFK